MQANTEQVTYLTVCTIEVQYGADGRDVFAGTKQTEKWMYSLDPSRTASTVLGTSYLK